MITSDLTSAYQAIQDDPENELLYAKFYEMIAKNELFLLLKEAAGDDQMSPTIATDSQGSYVLCFEDEDSMNGYTSEQIFYAKLPGRVLAPLLLEEKLGMALHAKEKELARLTPMHVEWIAKILATAPEKHEDRLLDVLAPEALPEALWAALQKAIEQCEGLLLEAYHVSVLEQARGLRQVLIFTGTSSESEAQFAQMVQDIVSFQAVQNIALDVAFLDYRLPIMRRIREIGKSFQVPLPSAQVDLKSVD